MTVRTIRKNLVLGAGLIGSHLAALLVELGEEVVILNKGGGYDLTQSEKYLDKFSWADRVWFVAWEVGVWKRDTPPEYESYIMDSNLQLCRSVFHVLQETKKPFLFVSSQAALAPDMLVLGVTKRVGEMWTRILGGHIARLWNVYGWEPVGERSHLVPDLIVKGLREGTIELMTSGEETRQFLHVRDCADALWHQFEIGQKEADVTSGEWVPVKKVAELIGKKLGVRTAYGAKPGKPSLFVPVTPLESWKPRLTLEDGIEEVIGHARIWIQQNP